MKPGAKSGFKKAARKPTLDAIRQELETLYKLLDTTRKNYGDGKNVIDLNDVGDLYALYEVIDFDAIPQLAEQPETREQIRHDLQEIQSLLAPLEKAERAQHIYLKKLKSLDKKYQKIVAELAESLSRTRSKTTLSDLRHAQSCKIQIGARIHDFEDSEFKLDFSQISLGLKTAFGILAQKDAIEADSRLCHEGLPYDIQAPRAAVVIKKPSAKNIN